MVSVERAAAALANELTQWCLDHSPHGQYETALASVDETTGGKVMSSGVIWFSGGSQDSADDLRRTGG